MTIITVENKFHNTEARIRAELKTTYDITYAEISDHQIKTLRKKLCGMKGCSCTSRWEARVKDKPVNLFDKDGIGIC